MKEAQAFAKGVAAVKDAELVAQTAAREAVPAAAKPGTQAGMTAQQHQKSIKTYEKRIDEHQTKLNEFEKSPTVKSEMLDKVSPEKIQQQQQHRIEQLKGEIKTFEKNIEKAQNAIKGLEGKSVE